MTRAKEALYLTSAEDMGGRRRWKTSQFVLEALDLPRDSAVSGSSTPAPPPEALALGLLPMPADEPLG